MLLSTSSLNIDKSIVRVGDISLAPFTSCALLPFDFLTKELPFEKEVIASTNPGMERFTSSPSGKHLVFSSCTDPKFLIYCLMLGSKL